MPETGSNVSFDTAKTVLVPVELYERGGEEDYLRFNGMALSVGEIAVASEPQDGIVAVMGVDAEAWNEYKKRGGVGVTSPLLVVTTGHRRDVNILLTADNAYVGVWEEGLRMAEVLPDNSVDSLLYYMQVVGRRFRLRKFAINVSGEKAGLVADTLRRYYKGVKVV